MKKVANKLLLILIVILVSIFVGNENHFYITVDDEGLYKVRFAKF